MHVQPCKPQSTLPNHHTGVSPALTLQRIRKRKAEKDVLSLLPVPQSQTPSHDLSSKRATRTITYIQQQQQQRCTRPISWYPSITPMAWLQGYCEYYTSFLASPSSPLAPPMLSSSPTVRCPPKQRQVVRMRAVLIIRCIHEAARSRAANRSATYSTNHR